MYNGSKNRIVIVPVCDCLPAIHPIEKQWLRNLPLRLQMGRLSRQIIASNNDLLLPPKRSKSPVNPMLKVFQRQFALEVTASFSGQEPCSGLFRRLIKRRSDSYLRLKSRRNILKQKEPCLSSFAGLFHCIIQIRLATQL